MKLKEWEKETEDKKINIQVHETDLTDKKWGMSPYSSEISVTEKKENKYLIAECRMYQSRNAAMNQARKWLKMYNL